MTPVNPGKGVMRGPAGVRVPSVVWPNTWAVPSVGPVSTASRQAMQPQAFPCGLGATTTLLGVPLPSGTGVALGGVGAAGGGGTTGGLTGGTTGGTLGAAPKDQPRSESAA